MTELPLGILAFGAGVLMFLAPCTLPLVPGYLAFIAGGEQKKIFRNAFAFVIGFSLIFILLGLFAGFIGVLLGAWRPLIARFAGALIVFFGLAMLGVRIPFVSAERHARIPAFLTLGSPQGSFLIGALFALGWSPCIGPILGTILLFASNSATALQGALLLALFSAGLAVPFLLCAWAARAAQSFISRAARATQTLSYVGGGVLVMLGILMITNHMGLLISWGFDVLNFIGYDRLLNYL